MKEDNNSTSENSKQTNFLRAITVMSAFLLFVGAVGALSGGVFVDGNIPLDANDGPTIVVETSDEELLLEEPFDDGDVIVQSPEGSATFSGDDSGSVNVKTADLEGDMTRLTNLDSDSKLTIDPADKGEIAFDGTAEHLEFRDYALDDGQTDVDIESVGESNLTIFGLDSRQGVVAVDGSGDVIDSTIAETDGSAEFSIDSGSYEIQFEKGPSEIDIRDESNPDELVENETEVELQFFADDEVITRTTDDGRLDMSGLPLDKPMTVQVSADGYVTRQSFIPSILEQQDVYLLPDDVDSVETTFALNDRTGAFPSDNARVLVEKPIERDGSTSYEVVVSDEIGVADYSTLLERDSRYRLSVMNEETGDTRVLGPYIATSVKTVELEVDSVQFDSGDTDIGYEWRAKYENESSPAIRFDFERTDADEIRNLELKITTRDGEETLFEDSYGNVDSINEVVDIPEDVEDPDTETWVVVWEAEAVNDEEVEEISGGQVVGADQMPIEVPGVDDDILNVVSVLLILLIAGLFSSANVTVGGIVTSLAAGALWFIGMTPPEVSGILIATGLFISVIAHLRTNQQVRPV